MKTLIPVLIIIAIADLGSVSVKHKEQLKKIQPQAADTNKPIALLELFTSEGCSSCPAADKLLAQVAAADSNVFALSFHVDYWNRLGWIDPFSKKEYSSRQSNYASHFNLESIYTPQLIVNGESELVGSNKTQVAATIEKALNEKAAVTLSIKDVRVNNNYIQFIVDGNGDFKNTNIIAAYVLRSATEEINAGENEGKTLSHINIVRALSSMPFTQETQFGFSLPAPGKAEDEFSLIVFAQRQDDLKITGAVKYRL